jgi:predicted amidohydrolase
MNEAKDRQLSAEARGRTRAATRAAGQVHTHDQSLDIHPCFISSGLAFVNLKRALAVFQRSAFHHGITTIVDSGIAGHLQEIGFDRFSATGVESDFGHDADIDFAF